MSPSGVAMMHLVQAQLTYSAPPVLGEVFLRADEKIRVGRDPDSKYATLPNVILYL